MQASEDEEAEGEGWPVPRSNQGRPSIQGKEGKLNAPLTYSWPSSLRPAWSPDAHSFAHSAFLQQTATEGYSARSEQTCTVRADISAGPLLPGPHTDPVACDTRAPLPIGSWLGPPVSDTPVLLIATRSLNTLRPVFMPLSYRLKPGTPPGLPHSAAASFGLGHA